jgi:hypothetical protein
MTTAITRSGGFIGSSLILFLTTGDHRVVRMLRSTSNGDHYDRNLKNVKSIRLKPLLSYASASSLNDNDSIYAVVNLYGGIELSLDVITGFCFFYYFNSTRIAILFRLVTNILFFE